MGDRSLRDALEKLCSDSVPLNGVRWVSVREVEKLLAADPAEPAQHEPTGVLPTDAGMFVACACGKNPTPKYWIEDHWTGERAEGERLVRDLLAAHLPGNRTEPAPGRHSWSANGVHYPPTGGAHVVERCHSGCPAEPAPVRQPSDAAVEAAWWAVDARWAGGAVPVSHRDMRKALEAAYRVDAPRPLLDREALDRRLETAKGHSWSIETTVDAVMELARQMPTRAELLDWVREIFDPEFKAPSYSEVAEKLLARLNGAG